MPDQIPSRDEAYRRHRRAQLEQVVQWWPLLVVLLLVPLAALWLWPLRPWLAVPLLGIGFMAFGALRWRRAAPNERLPPTGTRAREHYRAVTFGGAVVVLLGLLLLYLF